MTHEQQLVLIISLISNVLLLVLWLFREFHFAKIFSRFADGISGLPIAINALDKALQALATDLRQLLAGEKERTNDLLTEAEKCKRLGLDVENRVSNLIRDLRIDLNMARHQQGTNHNFFTQSNHGQTNQGQNVEGHSHDG